MERCNARQWFAHYTQSARPKLCSTEELGFPGRSLARPMGAGRNCMRTFFRAEQRVYCGQTRSAGRMHCIDEYTNRKPNVAIRIMQLISISSALVDTGLARCPRQPDN